MSFLTRKIRFLMLRFEKLSSWLTELDLWTVIICIFWVFWEPDNWFPIRMGSINLIYLQYDFKRSDSANRSPLLEWVWVRTLEKIDSNWSVPSRDNSNFGSMDQSDHSAQFYFLNFKLYSLTLFPSWYKYNNNSEMKI